MIKAGIMGATGYAGAEVLRICASHPEFEVAVITSDSEAGQQIADIYPAFHGVYDNLVLEPHATDSLLSCDVVFMGVPHKAGMLHAPRLVEAGVTCIDLSADFRFAHAADYEAVYHVQHAAPELLDRATFGQPETNRAALDELAARHAAGEAVIVGCAGCYVTASILAATPALAAGFVDPNAPIIVDAISGITRAESRARAPTIAPATNRSKRMACRFIATNPKSRFPMDAPFQTHTLPLPATHRCAPHLRMSFSRRIWHRSSVAFSPRCICRLQKMLKSTTRLCIAPMKMPTHGQASLPPCRKVYGPKPAR